MDIEMPGQYMNGEEPSPDGIVFLEGISANVHVGFLLYLVPTMLSTIPGHWLQCSCRVSAPMSVRGPFYTLYTVNHSCSLAKHGMRSSNVYCLRRSTSEILICNTKHSHSLSTPGLSICITEQHSHFESLMACKHCADRKQHRQADYRAPNDDVMHATL